MASFVENIRKIRGEAIYGDEMRTAIADAITQAINLDISGDGEVFIAFTSTDTLEDNYMLEFRTSNT